MNADDLQQPTSTDAPIESPDSLDSVPSIVPSFSSIKTYSPSSYLSPVVCDDRAITGLLETLMHKAGLTTAEMARRMGITRPGVIQYLAGRRTRPSLKWFVRFAELCGARVYVEWPK
jgi:DNA-binding XRE family transcriptional regulator